LLLLMAASAASLFATVRRFFSFSHQTGSLAVKANLPSRKNIGHTSDCTRASTIEKISAHPHLFR